MRNSAYRPISTKDAGGCCYALVGGRERHVARHTGCTQDSDQRTLEHVRARAIHGRAFFFITLACGKRDICAFLELCGIHGDNCETMMLQIWTV
jgi:hypothetical protein